MGSRRIAAVGRHSNHQPNLMERIQTNDKAIQALSDAGMGSRAIGTLLNGISYRTVCRRLRELTPRTSTQIFIHHRAEILAEMQRKLMNLSHGCSPKDRKDLSVAFGIYYDKERLERGKSTENQSIVIKVTRFSEPAENEAAQINSNDIKNL